MKLKIKYLVIISTCLIMGLSLLNGCAQQDKDNSQVIEALKLAQRANDLIQLNNLMSLHSWYVAARMNDVELEKIWSKRDDIVWAQSAGYWIGPESIKEYYGTKQDREATKGNFSWHTITSPVVEVAGDRKTAKGVWYTPGIVGAFRDDVGDFAWMFEKYGVDFIMEDEKWKIWHMHVYTDVSWPLGGKIEARGRSMGPPSGTVGPETADNIGKEMGSKADSGAMPQMRQPDKASDNYLGVSPTTSPVLVPRPPEPYETWSETWSYVDPGE